ncbi:hypothetical protein Q4491_20860 [Photobacterium sp. 2_MG-2023]|uniref:hypothetical protein n=1 Tax=Photobacterium sp. 2_MG-2023 TaxID=3062663 RepID=UPI0026E470C4|nr:hypothetical protein [Photobacterium sp. 2_MG-2023]MDO6583783.1 hypothetical protein [Photobacterium sp. 2_MG-2023]
MPVCSLVLYGPVVGAPGADNLKIRPEFFPWGVIPFDAVNAKIRHFRAGGNPDSECISKDCAGMSRLGSVAISPFTDARQTLFVGPKSAQKCLLVRWCGPGWL